MSITIKLFSTEVTHHHYYSNHSSQSETGYRGRIPLNTQQHFDDFQTRLANSYSTRNKLKNVVIVGAAAGGIYLLYKHGAFEAMKPYADQAISFATPYVKPYLPNVEPITKNFTRIFNWIKSLITT